MGSTVHHLNASNASVPTYRLGRMKSSSSNCPIIKKKICISYSKRKTHQVRIFLHKSGTLRA